MKSWQNKTIILKDLSDDELGDLGSTQVTSQPVRNGPWSEATGVSGEVTALEHQDEEVGYQGLSVRVFFNEPMKVIGKHDASGFVFEDVFAKAVDACVDYFLF